MIGKISKDVYLHSHMSASPQNFLSYYLSFMLLFGWFGQVLGQNDSSNASSRQPSYWYATADSLFQTKQFSQALKASQKADSLYQSVGDAEAVIKAKLLTYFSLVRTGAPSNTWQVPLQEALPFALQLESPSFELVRLYSSLSQILGMNDRPDASQVYCDEALRILELPAFKNHLDKPAFEISLNYRRGTVARFSYNYQEAIHYYQQALDASRRHGQSDHLAFGGLFKIQTLLANESAINQMVMTFKQEGYAQSKPLFFVYDFYSSYIDYFLSQEAYSEAMNQTLELKNLLAERDFQGHFSGWFIEDRIAEIHRKQGNDSLSLASLLQIANAPISSQYRKAEQAQLYGDIASSYRGLGQYEQAEAALLHAFMLNASADKPPASFLAPLPSGFLEKGHKGVLLDGLIEKAMIARAQYDQTANQDYLNAELDSYQDAHNLMKSLGDYSSEDHFIDNTTFQIIYGNALERFHQQWKKSPDESIFDQAFQLTEESQYVKVLSELQSKMDPSSLDETDNDLTDTEVNDSYNRIAFFWGRNHIYILQKSSKNKQFDRIRITTELETNIDHVIQGLRSPTNWEALKRSLAYVYSTLFEPYMDFESKTSVLLDDQLHMIPIGALWVASTDDPGHFLIEKTPLTRYQPGLKTRASKGAGKITLFAPFSRQGSKDYRPLPNSEDEVVQIGELFNSQTYLDTLANKEAFLAADSTSDILHLATHARVNLKNPSQSQILFYQEDPLDYLSNALTVSEIQKLRLQHQLVTLSGCDTGSGVEEKGKGIRSLSNAFSLAGVSSTLTSLWQIPDRETAELMTDFYKQLQKGLPKDEALQQAQLKFLSDKKEYPALQHPYYWSGFVMSGDTTALVTSEQFSIWWWFAPLFVIGCLVILWCKGTFQKRQ